MPIRDLIFPDDARHTVESLMKGLAYDAAVAHSGLAVSKAGIQPNGPVFTSGFRLGGYEDDATVVKELPAVLCRFALISMVSRLEAHAGNLLLQRRVLEAIGPTNARMNGPLMWEILKRVHKEARGGPVKLCSELVVKSPTDELRSRMRWLDGIYRVRNCLAHRLGIVQLADVRLPNQAWQDMEEGQTLKCTWLHMKGYLDDAPVEFFPFKMGQKLEVRFEESTREWQIGNVIEVTAEDCQTIAMSLSLLATQVLACFETEMITILKGQKS